MCDFLKTVKDYSESKSRIITTAKGVKKASERAKQYLVIKRAQCNLIFDLLTREKQRLIFTLLKEENMLRNFVTQLQKLSDKCLKMIIRDYYAKCNHIHWSQFAEWRSQIKKLQENGYTDSNDGYFYPYLKSRVVDSLDTINMRFSWLDTPLKQFQQKVTGML